MTTTDQNVLTESYVETARDIHAGLANLTEFIDTLPAVDENGNVQNVTYAHLWTLQQIKTRLAEIAIACDGFDE